MMQKFNNPAVNKLNYNGCDRNIIPPPNIKLHLTTYMSARYLESTSPLLGPINIVFFCRLLLNVYFCPLLEKQCGDKVSN